MLKWLNRLVHLAGPIVLGVAAIKMHAGVWEWFGFALGIPAVWLMVVLLYLPLTPSTGTLHMVMVKNLTDIAVFLILGMAVTIFVGISMLTGIHG